MNKQFFITKKLYVMDKIKNSLENMPLNEIVSDLKMQQIKGGVEDKRNRPGVKNGKNGKKGC